MIEDKNDYLQRAAKAFHQRVPPAFMLWYRELIELDRARYRRASKFADVGAFGRELINMDAPFARLTVERLSRSPEDAPLCLLLVARYVFAREAVNNRQWRRPDVGGCGDRELNDACLIHLLGLRRIADHAARPLRTEGYHLGQSRWRGMPVTSEIRLSTWRDRYRP